MDAEVNWTLLSEAVSHFKAHGFQYVEAPWTAPYDVLEATCPAPQYMIDSTIGGLVGSSEQSFMHLRRSGQIEQGKYVACTPCFRNEDTVNLLRQRTFMKVELYDDETHDLDGMIQLVMNFYRSLLKSELQSSLSMRDTGSHSMDIELGGIEVGSYGLREWEGLKWVYGTGIAEPRFSTARNLVVI